MRLEFHDMGVLISTSRSLDELSARILNNGWSASEYLAVLTQKKDEVRQHDLLLHKLKYSRYADRDISVGGIQVLKGSLYFVDDNGLLHHPLSHAVIWDNGKRVRRWYFNHGKKCSRDMLERQF